MLASVVAETMELSAESLRDKIRGGLLGQMVGNLNGLPHEMKYIAESGSVTGYVPELPDGTDFEWVYILEMQRRNSIQLPEPDIANLWRQSINQRFWCSNQYARQLMDLGIEPPLTGNFLRNPWADFNISGQFLCETYRESMNDWRTTRRKIKECYSRYDGAISGEPI